MFITHKLKKGETFATVARKYRVTDWKTSWDLKQNKALKAKRKYADMVEQGDVLVLLRPGVKLYRIAFAGKTYLVPADDWATLKQDVAKLMQKKFLPKLLAVKKTYDDDYEFMWNVANGNGALVGMMAAVVENLTFAKVPTAEMSAVSAAVSRVQKAIKATDFGGIVIEIGKLDAATRDYVAAAEKYRKKMTVGSTVGVKALTATRDGCFLLAGALATGGASAVAGTAFTAAEIGTAMGAAAALVKAGSDEIGQALSGNERSGSDITFRMVRDAYLGAGSGLIGGLIGSSNIGNAIAKSVAAEVVKLVPKAVAQGVVRGTVCGIAIRGTFDRLGDKAIAELVSKTILRLGVGWFLKTALDHIKAREHLDEVYAAAKTVMGGMTGNESPEKLGRKIGDALAGSKLSQSIVEAAMSESKNAVQAALDKANAKAG